MDVMVKVPFVSHVLSQPVELFLKQKILLGTNAGCTTAFINPNDTEKQVACQADNVYALSWLLFSTNAGYPNHTY